MEQSSDAFQKVQIVLKEIIEKLDGLSKDDLTNIHVSHEWSWVPYTKEHLVFLLEQVNCLLNNLKDSPPPVNINTDF